MMHRTSSLVLLCAAALLPFAAPLTAQDKDTILRKDGKHLTKVKLVKLDLDKLYYVAGGKEADIAVSLTLGFRFGGAPDAFVRGQSAAERGSHAAAGKLFDEVTKAETSELIKQTATFLAGRSLALAAVKDATQANNAVALLQTYLTAAPNGYYMPEAKVRLAQASLAGGDAAGAEKMLQTLDGEALSGNWAMYWAALIKFTAAQSQQAQQKFSEARASFQGVDSAVTAALGQESSHNAELQALRTEALVLQGETFVGQKMYDDALRYYQNLATNNARGVKAAAQAGEGQILFIQGTEKSDVEKLRQAQIALARASIEPDTTDSTSAKALYYMGKVLVALGDKEENALARAKTYFAAVKNTYGTTVWAALARKELEG